ncbi:MAG: hypothetical protein BGO69_06675 [Bacteroidetes bacterium 46-16]|nr:MAG: hypothetical protein BGO69_06675 [Bacteroidetes bacterium 46-16]
MSKNKLPPATQVINGALYKRVKGYTQYYINESGDVWGIYECQLLKVYMVQATSYRYCYLYRYGKKVPRAPEVTTSGKAQKAI